MQIKTRNLIANQEDGMSCGKKFWPMLAGFYALFILRNAFSVGFPVFVYLVWIAVMASAFNETEIKALIVSFIPLAPGFQSKYAALVCMLILLIKYGRKMKMPVFLITIPFLMFWEFLHLGGEYSSTAEFLSGFAPLLCLAVVVSLPSKHEDTSFFSRVLAVSLVVGGLLMIANTAKGGQQSIISLIRDGVRLGTVEESENYQITYNANGLGFLCNLSVAGVLTNIYFKRSKKMDYFLMAFAIVLGCLTVSRTFLLCLVGTFILYGFLQEKTVAQKLKTFFMIAGLLFLAIVVLNMVEPRIVENYIERFNVEDVTSGRNYLFDFYNDFITSSPERFWYGIGIQKINLKVQRLIGVCANVPHNGYQQMAVAWGVVGLFAMMFFVLCLVLRARKKNPRVSLMCYLPLALLLVNIMAGQFVTSGTKLFSLIYIYLVLCNGGTAKAKALDGKKQRP